MAPLRALPSYFFIPYLFRCTSDVSNFVAAITHKLKMLLYNSNMDRDASKQIDSAREMIRNLERSILTQYQDDRNEMLLNELRTRVSLPAEIAILENLLLHGYFEVTETKARIISWTYSSRLLILEVSLLTVLELAHSRD
jgi:hypothetical protein